LKRPRQNGVALVTAVVLVALATIIAVAIGSRSALSARRSAGNFGYEQAVQFAAGAEALAAYALHEDRNAQDSLADSWAKPFGPAEVAPGITLEAQLGDEQGKFNLNTLVNARGEADPDAVAVFTRLLELLQLETRWAPLLVDWIDADVLPGTEGGEDALYLSQHPPYRAANQPVTSVSELLQLPGFGLERYMKLAPHVTALPADASQVNVCMATPFVLDALAALGSGGARGSVEYSAMDARQFAEARGRGCFPGAAVLKSQLRPDAERRIGERSSYFRLRSFIGIGTARFALYSLLRREPDGQVRTVLRTLGTE
jgi:general secretion pathway protein K